MKIAVFAVLLAVMQAAPPVPRKTANAKTDTPKTVKRDSPKEQQPSPPASPIAGEQRIEGKVAQQASGTDTPKNENQTVRVSELPPVSVTRDWMDCVGVFFSFALVVIGFFGVRAAIHTLRAIQKQADEMVKQNSKFEESIVVARDAAQAAKDSAEQARKATEVTQQQFVLIKNKERSRLIIEYEKLEFKREDTINASVKYHIRFVGISPAFIVSKGAIAKFVPSIFAPDTYLDMGIPSVVNADVRGLMAPVLPPKMSPEDVEGLRKGTAHVEFSAFIEYRDTVDEDEIRRTAINLRWVVSPIFGDHNIGKWEPFGSSHDNVRT